MWGEAEVILNLTGVDSPLKIKAKLINPVLMLFNVYIAISLFVSVEKS